ncbi:hypothetical protein BJ508DRAFT_341265 [Ascobolus immersus RN42]|uniref:F-box domain-containing protein n=1 Tax=Ascobolus immersus RN42 TaxID=1160509 RepID=A0A3N4HJH9_ASCIM|nr:hypothetical protein BJ508DRAFT_341265 [Ascobolus immersus RN42]
MAHPINVESESVPNFKTEVRKENCPLYGKNKYFYSHPVTDLTSDTATPPTASSLATQSATDGTAEYPTANTTKSSETDEKSPHSTCEKDSDKAESTRIEQLRAAVKEEYMKRILEDMMESLADKTVDFKESSKKREELKACLPNEILHEIAHLCVSPGDYHAFGLVNKHLYNITHTPFTRSRFLNAYLQSHHTRLSEPARILEFIYTFIRHQSNELLRLEREQGYLEAYSACQRKRIRFIINGPYARNRIGGSYHLVKERHAGNDWAAGWKVELHRMQWSFAEKWRLGNLFVLPDTKPEQRALYVSVEVIQDPSTAHFRNGEIVPLFIRQEWLRDYHHARASRLDDYKTLPVAMEDAVLVERLQKCWVEHDGKSYGSLKECVGKVYIEDYVGYLVMASNG